MRNKSVNMENGKEWPRGFYASYILVAFPIFALIMLIIASKIHVEYTQVYAVSEEICMSFRNAQSTSAVLAERTHMFSMLRRMQQEKQHTPAGLVRLNSEMQMLALSSSRNTKLTPMWPLRVEAGTFGLYFQLGFADAYEMCNYFLLPLQLRRSPWWRKWARCLIDA